MQTFPREASGVLLRKSKPVKFDKLLAGWEMFNWTPDFTADRKLEHIYGVSCSVCSVVSCELMTTFNYMHIVTCKDFNAFESFSSHKCTHYL